MWGRETRGKDDVGAKQCVSISVPGWRSLSAREGVEGLAPAACLPGNASASCPRRDRAGSFGPPSRGSAHPGAEPSQVPPRTTMQGGSIPRRFRCSHRVYALDNSRLFLVGSAVKPRTNHVSYRCHGFPCRRRCWHRSSREDTDCLNAVLSILQPRMTMKGWKAGV